jgi:phage terminase Nu1 subunit (DNA packaging protein)
MTRVSQCRPVTREVCRSMSMRYDLSVAIFDCDMTTVSQLLNAAVPVTGGRTAGESFETRAETDIRRLSEKTRRRRNCR